MALDPSGDRLFAVANQSTADTEDWTEGLAWVYELDPCDGSIIDELMFDPLGEQTTNWSNVVATERGLVVTGTVQVGGEADSRSAVWGWLSTGPLAPQDWQVLPGSGGRDALYDIAVDPNGSIWTAGMFRTPGVAPDTWLQHGTTEPGTGCGDMLGGSAAFGVDSDGVNVVVGARVWEATPGVASVHVLDASCGCSCVPTITTPIPSVNGENVVPNDVEIVGARVLLAGHVSVDGAPRSIVMSAALGPGSLTFTTQVLGQEAVAGGAFVVREDSTGTRVFVGGSRSTVDLDFGAGTLRAFDVSGGGLEPQWAIEPPGFHTIHTMAVEPTPGGSVFIGGGQDVGEYPGHGWIARCTPEGDCG